MRAIPYNIRYTIRMQSWELWYGIFFTQIIMFMNYHWNTKLYLTRYQHNSTIVLDIYTMFLTLFMSDMSYFICLFLFVYNPNLIVSITKNILLIIYLLYQFKITLVILLSLQILLYLEEITVNS